VSAERPIRSLGEIAGALGVSRLRADMLLNKLLEMGVAERVERGWRATAEACASYPRPATWQEREAA
jgi:predicted transcriptional regulator